MREDAAKEAGQETDDALQPIHETHSDGMVADDADLGDSPIGGHGLLQRRYGFGLLLIFAEPPVFQQPGLVQLRPDQNEVDRPPGHVAFHDLQRLDVDNGLVLAVAAMEVRRRMLRSRTSG